MSRITRALEAFADGEPELGRQILDDLRHELWQTIERAPSSASVARLLKPVAGRRVVGVVDGSGHVELVFEGVDTNLLSIGTDMEAPDFGSVRLGYIAPELVASGYGVGS